MNRYRLVTTTDNDAGHEQHVSSVVLNRDEAMMQLAVEQELAERAGWRTRREGIALVCSRGTTTRRIGVRESTPFDDVT